MPPRGVAVSRRIEWPAAGITGPGLWVSTDRLTWQRMPDGLTPAERTAWHDGIPWRISAHIETPRQAVDAMRSGLGGLLKPRKAGAP